MDVHCVLCILCDSVWFFFLFYFTEYYRVTINFTSLTYEDALASRITSRFQQLARLLSLDIEQLYATTEGQQMATVIQFQPSG